MALMSFTPLARAQKFRPLWAPTSVWPEGLEAIQHGKGDGGWSINLLIEAGPKARSVAAREDDYLAYRNLSALITSAIFDGMHYRPRTDFQQLAQHQTGLVAMVGGLQSPLGAAIRSGRPDVARSALEQLDPSLAKTTSS